MLVPDKMHEFDLGVWKALLVHIVRILETLPANKVREFNSRFRQMPTFGRDKIRRFARNVSELSRMAARDYEDILLCIIPCLEGLLPTEDEKSILDLLYIMNYWNALASLRVHTSSTVRILDDLTTELGKALRYFADVTCSHFETRETEKELGKRKRAEARRAATATASGVAGESLAPATASRGRRPKTFSLGMIKLHFLGDYTEAIRQYGSLEHFSTKTGELEHRVVKKRRARTGNVNFVPQLVKAETRERVHDRMHEELSALSEKGTDDSIRKSTGATVGSDPGVDTKDLREHHHIAADESGERLYLASWLTANGKDPAFQSFMRKLREHLLARLENYNHASDPPAYNDLQLAQVVIQNDRVFPHATLAVNYTTYDIRRDQDLIHVPAVSGRPPDDDFLGHRDVMVYNTSDIRPHPFAYARVLKVFHARISHPTLSPEPRRVEFLWVRWFSLIDHGQSGPTKMRLERLQYLDGPSAFGFVDPSEVIRGCHLMPVFHRGRTRELLGPSLYRDSSEGDWASYYVGRFVDRDMMMRYLGVGIGHLNPPTFPHELNANITVDDSPGCVDRAEEEHELDSLCSVDSDQPVDTDDEQ
ncbi:uncharacterized protein SCHCODRAFT_01150321 [Schizophyllum commune H4-8]|uniref:Uncharacterized protein n=1 Tax=Schizophyllum commune (strain H4-8 / FGSC 9210) TaxID=578458 RepID=D8PZK7_SCHCM|nr:uncharacterized protein SCHCODRAFT_01150321 [Schizophyllum commune H4-8]KAI5896414.1 hypothetical protein SCHCODRAFT_01150321 [Schizophyllum commune H4-8]